MEPAVSVRKADPRTGIVYKSIYVRTSRFPCLNFYYVLFYELASFFAFFINSLITT